MFDLFGFLGSLGGLIQSGLSAIVSALAYIVGLLQAAVIYLWGVVVAVAEFMLTAFRAVAGVFKAITDTVMKRIILPVLNFVDKVRAWLNKTLSPFLKWAQQMRRQYDAWFNRYMKPVLNLIQRMRAFLHLLKLFHVGWATKLDNTLASIQNRIVHNFEVLRQRLNQTISWIDLVVDPYGLLKAGPLANSIGRGIDDILVVLTGHDLTYYHGSAGFTPGSPTPGRSFDDMTAAMSAATAGTGNEYSGAAQVAVGTWGTLAGTA